jgi:hypothetical protein
VGVFVISFLNLRFGWTYSGLVIPGYLVPLILTNPASAAITFAEGILAYALVRLVSEYLSQVGWWCNFFGRDRFFALLLSAVLVRVVMDGWCLPALASWIQHQWHITLDYKGAFHSFGLIIIALIANQFWKTGFWRGLAPFAVTVGLTFVIIRFVLMTVTNFNVGHMAYMYSNTAASLLASPKSYIILVVTGFVASRMNLRYGWEYNGILIPALLALQWYEPLKIVSSLAEAAVVYIVSDRLLQTSLFRGTTVEGARKLLLFFNVAYAYRLVLGFVLPLIAPDVAVNDYYGFAYMLSSLIALKMHSKQIVLRLARATIQTSFTSAVAANLLGLWLASLLGSISFGGSQNQVAMAPLESSSDPLEVLASREKLRILRKHAAESVLMPEPIDLNRFQDALGFLKKYVDTGSPADLARAQRRLAQLHFSLERVAPDGLCLREQEPSRGWGFYFIDLRHRNGLLLEVPSPLEEWSTVDSALDLFNELNASALAIAGGARYANKDGSADVLSNANTPFQVFHKTFGRRNVLQVRGATEESVHQVPDLAVMNALYVKSDLPRSLSLSALQSRIGDFQVVWKPAPPANVQQRRIRSGFAELWLTRTTRIRLKSELSVSHLASAGPASAQNGRVLEWLLEQKRAIARGGSNRFVPAKPEEMRFLDEEVLAPLLEAARDHYQSGRITPEGQRSIQAINWSAALLGYQVCFQHDDSLDHDFFILAELPQASPPRQWGTFVIRLGESKPYAIQVPRPLFDVNSLECGVDLFERIQAESLLLAGSHNEANEDQSSDVLDFRNSANFFSLVNQVVMRESRDKPKMAIQCRGYSPPPGLLSPPEFLVAFQDGIHTGPALTPLGRTLVDSLTASGFSYQFVDGSPLTAGYEISCVPQAQYVMESARKEFAILWLSPSLREAFRAQDENDPLRTQIMALGIPLTAGDLKRCLAASPLTVSRTRVPRELKAVLDDYVVTLDIAALQKAIQEWPRYQFTALLDRNSQQLLLLISDGLASAPAVLNLRPRSDSLETALRNQAGQIDVFLASRGMWLEWPL